jgi:hypothetical protein
MAAKAVRFNAIIKILGLDMSRAFDTISRAKLMEILKLDVGLEEDELRICQSLLADTVLRVRLNKTTSAPFNTTIGTPQGDGLSPILFAIYLERALRDVRANAPARPLIDISSGIPQEALYADDCDFLSHSQEWLESLEPIIPPTIGTFQLVANDKKWERTTIQEDRAACYT